MSDPDVPTHGLTCTLGADDTCGGELRGCSSYSFTPNPNMVGWTCIVAIRVTDDGSPAMFAGGDAFPPRPS